MFSDLKADYQAIYKSDPAARGIEGILYPGFHAILIHRILSNPLYRSKAFFLARLVSQVSRFLTGVEIHPGASLGEGLFIDHGMGIVIGETSVVGKNVILFHGVTLGGRSGKTEQRRRHPIIGDNVIIGANSSLLGAIHIGNNVKIGAHTLVLKDVEEGATIIGNPMQRVR